MFCISSAFHPLTANQIYYVNTQTGQRSRYLPQEAEDETSDSELAGLTSQSTSRSGTSAGLAFGLSDSADPSSESEGATRPSSGSDIWVRKLADDGISYYYVNTHNRRVQWTAPEPATTGNASTARSIATLPTALSNQPDTSRLSVYSDDSEIQPFDHLPTSRPRQNNGPSARPPPSSTRSEPNPVAIMELTSAERIAKALQHALEPPPPNVITDLSAISRSAIQAVVENVQSTGMVRQPKDDQNMDQLIFNAVLAVRNLLYVAAASSNQTSAMTAPTSSRDRAHSSAQPLKPAQRKVTATLSRLVLSARAMQYDSGSQLSDTLRRIETDSEELERSVLSFVLEVQRNENLLPDEKPPKRLQGIFSTSNVGLGLVGGGTAGTWKGFGYLAQEDEKELPQKVLGTEVVSEIGLSLSQLQEGFAALSQALRLSNG